MWAVFRSTNRVSLARRIAIVVIVFSVGCNRRIPRTPSLDDVFRKGELAEVVLAACDEDEARLSKALKQTDVNQTGRWGITPLLWTIMNNKFTAYELLLQHGANPNILAEDGRSVMRLGAGHADSRWLSLALEHNGDPNLLDNKNRYVPLTTPIFDAIAHHRVDNASMLLQAGANFNVQNGRGETPLNYACQFGQYDIAYKLLMAGADHRLRTPKGSSVARLTQYESPNPIILPGQEHQELFRRKIIKWLVSQGEIPASALDLFANDPIEATTIEAESREAIKQ
ncbi:MAG: ankyrin repeat domain-containing protein [Planctomycetales bacterium]|nr:ankyrin repeat domain-containing protein [Planctomycetales bacterium]